MWRGWTVWTGKANRIIVVVLEVIKVWVDGGRVGLDVSRLVLVSKLNSKVNVGEGGTREYMGALGQGGNRAMERAVHANRRIVCWSVEVAVAAVVVVAGVHV